MSRACAASSNPVRSGAGRTRTVRVSMRPRLISLVAAATGVFSQSSAFRVSVQAGLVAQDGPQPVRVLDLPEEQGVVPVRLHGVAGDDGPGDRQRREQRLEVADLVGLPGFRDPVLADHDPGHVGDGGEQVHLLVLAGLRALALLPVDGDSLARGNVPGIAAGCGFQPRVLRVRPEPAVLPLLPERLRARRLPLPLLPLFLLLMPLFRAVRGIRGRDRGIQREHRPRPPTARPRTRRDPAVSRAGPASTPTAPPASRSAG